MTITYNHTAFPTQQIVYPPSASSQLVGRPLAGARVFTYRSSAHTTPKATYQTNVGNPPPANTNPVVANTIGQVTIYWALDDTDITDLYFVQIKGPTGDDTVYYSYDNFDGSALMGSQPNNTRIDFNFVRNPQFTWNRFKTSYNVSTLTSSGETAGSFVADDWYFTKNNNNATESVTITPFSAGQTDVPYTPVNYLSWNLTGGASGETYKNIYQKYKSVQTLSGQQVSLQFYARSSTSSILTVNYRQYFGTGGSPSTDNLQPFVTQTLSTTWRQYTATITIDGVSGKTFGSNGNDLLQLEFALPLNAGAGANIDLCNVQLEIGSAANAFQYETPNDQRNRLDKDWFGVPTGDIKIAAGAEANYPGWIALDDGTIGNAVSGATSFADEDACALFIYLYLNFADAQCPVSGGRTGITAATALADFNASKRITLPLTMGRLIGNAGAGSGLTNRANGVTGGAETHTNTIAEMPAHNHPGSLMNYDTSDAAGGGNGFTFGVSPGTTNSTALTIASQGSGTAWNIMNPFSFINYFIKL